MQDLQTIEQQEPEIDPITGEILEGLHKEAPEERLGQIGRWISGTMNCLDHLATPVSGCFCRNCMQTREFNHVQDRLELLRELRDRRIAKLKTKIAEEEMRAKEIVDTNDGKTVKITGIGTFLYRKGSESVDTTGYDTMEDITKEQVQAECPNLFKFKASPDKGAIKQVFAESTIKINELAYKSFTLKRPVPTFRFTPEK